MIIYYVQNITNEILLCFFLAITAGYILLIAGYNIAWFNIKHWKITDTKPNTKVSVIIPARNESENILRCIENVCAQTYPSDLLEIIIVDDSSTDNTAYLVKNFISKAHFKNISLIELASGNLSSKKQAISEAVKIAKGSLIITTDADCVMSSKWIISIVEYFEKYNPVMIIGPVSFCNESGVFQKMQSLEFMSLIASGAASAHLGTPIMCNGANLAYEKEVFLKTRDGEASDKFVSGDDIFLMHKIKKTFKRKIVFIKSRDALVQTKPQVTVKSFLNQRKRWVSKSHGYTDTATIITALMVFLFNFILLSCFIFSFFSSFFFNIFIICFASKLIVDFPILMGASSFFKKKKMMYFYIPLQLIYPVYIVFTGLSGLFGNFSWKDRIYSGNETK